VVLSVIQYAQELPAVLQFFREQADFPL